MQRGYSSECTEVVCDCNTAVSANTAVGPAKDCTTVLMMPSSSGVQISDRALFCITWILDYLWLGSIGWVVFKFFGTPAAGAGAAVDINTTRGLTVACATLGVLSVLALHCREQLYFYIMGNKVPDCKRSPIQRKTYWYIFQTAFFSMTSFGMMHKTGVIYFSELSLTFECWREIFIPFFALLVLRDAVFLGPLHALLHTKKYYHLHKLHHEQTNNAQSLHAFHIDLIDLVIENVGAPFLLFGCQHLLGYTVGIHWLSATLLTFHDGALHSINPYSVMYFTPGFDCFLHGNVTHQLHHALNKGYYRFVPYRHVFEDDRKADCSKYNKTFKTNFSFF